MTLWNVSQHPNSSESFTQYVIIHRSTDLPANSSQVEALENENMALKIQLKDVQAERDSLKLALTCLAKDLNGLIYNQESTEKNQKPQEASEKTSANDGPWEEVEKETKKCK